MREQGSDSLSARICTVVRGTPTLHSRRNQGRGCANRCHLARHRCQTADGALRAAAIALLQARRAGRVNADDEEAVLTAARHGGISAAAAAIAARDCALAGLTSDEPFARLAAIISRRCAEAPAAARAQCGLAALRLRKRTWRRLGGKVTFSDDAALAELWDYSKSEEGDANTERPRRLRLAVRRSRTRRGLWSSTRGAASAPSPRR